MITKIVVALVTLYTLIGFVVLPYLIQTNFSKTLKTFTNIDGYLEKVYINPYTFELELTNLLIQDKKNRNLLYLNKFAVDFELTSIFKDILVVNYIYLKNLKTNIILDKKGISNFQYILDFLNQEKIAKTENNKQLSPFLLKVNDIKLINNRVAFIDNSKSIPFEIETQKFNIMAQNLSLLSKDKGKISLDIDVSDTARLKINSLISLNPIKLDGNLILDNLRIDKISAYIKDNIDFDLSGERINLDFKYRVELKDNNLKADINNINSLIYNIQYAKKDLKLNLIKLKNRIEQINIQKDIDLLDIKLNGKLIIQDLNLVKGSLLNINKIETNLAYDLSVKNDDIKVIVNDINILLNDIQYKNKDLKAQIPIFVNNIKQINIQKDIDLLDIKLNGNLMMQDLKVTKGSKLDINKIDTKLAYNVNLKNDTLKVIVDDTNILLNDVKYKDKNFKVHLTALNSTVKQINIKKQDKKMGLLVKDIKLKDGDLIFNDLTKKAPIKLNIKNINAKVDKVTLDKSLPIKFNLSINTPHKGKLSTKGDVVIKPLKVDLKVKANNISFVPYAPYVKEFVNIDLKSGLLNSNLNINLDKKDKILDPSVSGNISVDNISIFHNLTNKKLFSLKQLNINDLNYKTNDLNIKKILIDSSYLKFAIAKNKTTNFDNITPSNNNDTIKSESNNSKSFATKDKNSNFKYFIHNVELKDGKIDFSDSTLPLDFTTRIDTLTANIKDISSNDTNTKVKLTGVVDKYGMVTIVGSTNMADYKKQSDIKIDFENLDLISVSPYSGKFLGSKIATGKLWLDLNYKIKDSNLTSTNNMKIKKLTLGKPIQSKDAVDLPIGLVIALLEDSDGLVDVNVPVYGDINNPEFELSGAIWGAVGNVITNIITSPFRFLGALSGVNSEELDSIDFDYGLSILLPSEKEKLDTLAKALVKKPNLSLKVNPVYNESNDLMAFQKNMLMNLIDKKNKDYSIKKLFIKEFGNKEYKKLKTSSKTKSINQILIDKLIPTMIVKKENLVNLASQRAYMVKNYLLTKNLDSNRVIISKKIKVSTIKNKQRLSIDLNIDIKK
jgi:hypothetical protein